MDYRIHFHLFDDSSGLTLSHFLRIQLITTSDIQSLVRRMGSRGVHFETQVALDLVMLASRLQSWYLSAREDQPYPIYPKVAHPPLPQQRQRPLPMRIPMVTLEGAQIQYQPPQHQPMSYGISVESLDAENDEESEVQRMRPSAPRPAL